MFHIERHCHIRTRCNCWSRAHQRHQPGRQQDTRVTCSRQGQRIRDVQALLTDGRLQPNLQCLACSCLRRVLLGKNDAAVGVQPSFARDGSSTRTECKVPPAHNSEQDPVCIFPVSHRNIATTHAAAHQVIPERSHQTIWGLFAAKNTRGMLMGEDCRVAQQPAWGDVEALNRVGVKREREGQIQLHKSGCTSIPAIQKNPLTLKASAHLCQIKWRIDLHSIRPRRSEPAPRLWFHAEARCASVLNVE